MKYLIITAPDCKWCDKAKEELEKSGHDFTEVSTLDASVRTAWNLNNFKTVPQIYNYIGGYEDLVRHLNK